MSSREAKLSAMKMPRSLGACADLLADLREERLALQKRAEAIKARERAVEEHVIRTLPKDDTGAAGRHHRVRVVTKEVPTVEDWDELYAYVRRTKSFHLLARRLNEAGVRELWEDRKRVPGVGVFTAVTVSLVKV
jgi:hypothetical protein